MIFIITGYDRWSNAFVIGRQYLKNGCPVGMRSAKQTHGLLLAIVLMCLVMVGDSSSRLFHMVAGGCSGPDRSPLC